MTPEAAKAYVCRALGCEPSSLKARTLESRGVDWVRSAAEIKSAIDALVPNLPKRTGAKP